MAVEVDVPTAVLQKMFARIEAVFEKLANEEPYWTVLTQEKYKMASIKQNRQEFYDSGKRSIEILKAFACRAGIDLTSLSCCFELGCGVGRITVWLAELFPRVLGWDISRRLLDETSAAMTAFGRRNVELTLANKFTAYEHLPEFDIFYSTIVFQHNPPPVIHYMLGCLLDRLRPGGVGLFQVPTYQVGYVFSADAYLAKEPRGDGIEMHVLPQKVLIELLEEKGCRLLELREDGATGPGEARVSNTVFVQKRPW